jgi:hypothetical protein
MYLEVWHCHQHHLGLPLKPPAPMRPEYGVGMNLTQDEGLKYSPEHWHAKGLIERVTLVKCP